MGFIHSTISSGAMFYDALLLSGVFDLFYLISGSFSNTVSINLILLQMSRVAAYCSPLKGITREEDERTDMQKHAGDKKEG